MTRYFRNILVGNGYLIPPCDMSSDHANYAVYTAAQEGDEDAQSIIRTLAFTGTEQSYLASKLGVNISFSYSETHGCTIHLQHAHYPPSFKGACLPQLRKMAAQGNWCAERVLALITQKRMTHHEFKVQDENE